MKKILLFIIFLYGSTQVLYSQDNIKGDGVVPFSIPIRNSLKFNRYIINPAFSFVREQNTYASFYNKRQWVQFDNAPQTYLFSYSGRFRENQGIGVGLFQQNYGLITTFGIVGNFAHNVVLQEESNLTFGANVGFYKSGLDQGKIISNDSNLNIDNIPSNSLLTINPGINYGNAFLDVGLSVNNLLLYNFATSEMVKDNPEQAVEVHLMYTGYIDAYGFFDRSKFSGLVKSEFKKDKTVISGLAMISIPKGFWAQAGYNTLYGMSAGFGVNVTPKIAIEYNYEKGTGNFSNFGASHEFVIAYKFKSRNYYYGDNEEDDGALIAPGEVKKMAPAKITSPVTKTNGAEKAKLAAEAKAKADAAILQARLEAQAKVKADAEAKIKLAADAKAKANAEAIQARLSAQAKIKADAEAKIKLAADNRANVNAIAQARIAAAKLKAAQSIADAEAKRAKLAADNKAKADAAAQARLKATQSVADAEANRAKLAADAKAKVDAAAQAKLDAAKSNADAEALKAKQLSSDGKTKVDATVLVAKLAADAKAKEDAATLQAKLAADTKVKADAAALQLKLDADAKAKADALKVKLAADAKAKADAIQVKLDADAKLKADAKAKVEAAELKAIIDADAKAKAESDALQAKLAAEAKAKAKADAIAFQAKLVADAKAKANTALLLAKEAADAKAKADAEVKVKADAAALIAKLAAEVKIKAKAKADADAKLAADDKAKADADALQIKVAADAKTKADADAKAKLEADAKAKADALEVKLAQDAVLKAKQASEAIAAANAAKDESAKSIDNLTNMFDSSYKTQTDLLNQLTVTVSKKQKDLNDLREENDLSEKGIYKEPKPFKSVASENSELEALKLQIAQVNREQKDALDRLTNLYNERLKKVPNKNDALNKSYLAKIEALKVEQLKAERENTDLIASLEKIKLETEIERKRRIKRAAFENDQGRYQQDVAALKRIKETTRPSSTLLTANDFDFGDEQSNMQIIKNVKNAQSGYYLIIAVHSSSDKRDQFLTKAVSAGQSDINFFYNVSSSKYYIYYEKYDNLTDASKALEAKGNKSYNGKMSIVKVENE
ncbi:PorP/SprF family type IX secretion system membrane protein [Flavobacterium sp. ALJ2]|uniref:PorP/SprF family type IX secretion system membrane protein n=1 Tax=Flavobacterium sp. ALJ2 TaxID=2786960 RepID=UPI00189F3D68|nr:type IX secretion system membrane protein PorP/SprF [Flavobacterium sp. ALJ2]MBF7092849.1 PorP/SprF family type IX secretion system membrane protein [Flavobacterium sp. ALJ2]